jgi:hypothetical protein
MIERLVLVKPPERSAFNFGAFSLGTLAGAVRQLAEVSILDATDAQPAQAAQAVFARQPDLIGITAMGLTSVRPVVDFIQALRTAGKGLGKGRERVPIIAGGHGASMAPIPILEAGADAVVVGEGELTLRQIIERGIVAGSPGLACRVDGQVVTGPPQQLIQPLDRLAFPARDLMAAPPDGIHLMETSRGCPHACAFCETTRFYGRRWRPHSPERVVAEIERLVDDHNAWIIHFADDNFAASPLRVKRICEKLQRVALPVFFMASARTDDLVSDPDLLPAMAAARILRVTVGVETLDQDAASRINKPIPLETHQQAFQRMRELGIFSVASLIVGLPDEDPTAREQSVERAIEAGPDSAHFLPFLPLPGIPLAASYEGCDPDPRDVQDAREYSLAFLQHPIVQARLEEAAAGDDIRGLLARATLARRAHAAGPPTSLF